jgi:hypothetical protein
MKKIILFIQLLQFLIRSFGQQQTTSAPITKTDYLQKSKSQKTVAWILFGGGTIMMITGVVVMSENLFTTKGTGLAVAGLIVSVASIPLFIASGKNKRRAASLSFNNIKTQQIKNSSMVYRPIPTVSIKINL